ncbi:MAG: hypothetical protein IBX58_10550 [Roseovarius sp.]|nr:hypothetical protein [Roseovarius sp.]
MRGRTIRLRFPAFIALTRMALLLMFLGIAFPGITGGAAVQAHPADTVKPIEAAQAIADPMCCHDADHGTLHADCALSICHGLGAPVGQARHDLPRGYAVLRRVTGRTGLASRSHPPILHPPILA